MLLFKWQLQRTAGWMTQKREKIVSMIYYPDTHYTAFVLCCALETASLNKFPNIPWFVLKSIFKLFLFSALSNFDKDLRTVHRILYTSFLKHVSYTQKNLFWNFRFDWFLSTFGSYIFEDPICTGSFTSSGISDIIVFLIQVVQMWCVA